VARIRSREPHSVVVSAATGAGIPELLTAVELDLPNPTEQVDLLVPFDRGDLVARVHEEGRDVLIEYTGEGAQIRAVVGEQLAAELNGVEVGSAGGTAPEVGSE
jgi:GTP-binding protein HflX